MILSVEIYIENIIIDQIVLFQNASLQMQIIKAFFLVFKVSSLMHRNLFKSILVNRGNSSNREGGG